MVMTNSFRYPASNIRHEQRNIRAILDKKDLGLGTLIISESTLCWQLKDDNGFSIPYQDISLHAISKDESVYSRECVYLLLDGKFHMPGDGQQNNIEVNDDCDSDEDESEENHTSELILVPDTEDNTASIKHIYECIKICQELNPDPDDMDEDDDNLYADAEEGHYVIDDRERGGGDADIDEIASRLEGTATFENSALSNGNNEDDEFQDAD